MDWYQTIFELIDMRSFSNLWYWIGIAVFWSMLGHWVLGVPNDMLRRAASDTSGQTLRDVEALAAVHIRRILFIARAAGIWLVAVLSFLLSGLFLMALHYRIEFAQAVLCLLVPYCVVFLLTIRTARRIEAQGLSGTGLVDALRRHRLTVQGMGMVAIFLTGMYGMYQNLLVNHYG